MPQKPILREYSGKQILEIDNATLEPIVEGFIYKNDYCIMAGQPKTNKSVFAMQLACAVSSGTLFLDRFNVPKAERVWYFSTEGKDDEVKDRFLRMSKVVKVNFDNIRLFCSTQFKVNTSNGLDIIYKLIDKHQDCLPQLVIIDSVFASFFGKLSDDVIVNDYITKLRGITERCGDAAFWLAHHTKKPSTNSDGMRVEQDSVDTYGSTFFVGQADASFIIKRHGKEEDMNRIITCSEQRSGRNIERLIVHLNEPNPLHLSVMAKHDKECDDVCTLLINSNGGLKAHQIAEKTKMTKSLTYMVLNELLLKSRLKKTAGYNGLYTLNLAP
jgi:KaiC/GvpD/RAD55 family RecA-like ATPase